MRSIHQTAFVASAGLLAGRLMQQLPERERHVWIRTALGVLLLVALLSLMLSGCTLEAEGHKLAITPLPGWSWHYEGTTTNTVQILR